MNLIHPLLYSSKRAFIYALLLMPFWVVSSSAQNPASSADPKLQQVAFMVSRFLQEEHFARQPIDEKVSKEWIRNYMQNLDYGKLYFLNADYNEFLNTQGDTIGKKVRYGDISPAFEIFQRFRERFDHRVEWVQERLKKPFDFNTDDYYITDPTEIGWPASAQEADALWERRLKYELLQAQIAELSEKDGAFPSVDPKTFQIDPAVVKKVLDRHLRRVKYTQETDQEDIVETYLSSLAGIYDPHSQYLSQKSYEDFFISMNQKLFGIGAILSADDGYCTIREIIKGGPADLSGQIKVNDRITGVGQSEGPMVDIIDMKLRDAVRLIRGTKGTTVRLEVIPNSEKNTAIRREISLVRDEIKLTHQKAQAKLIEHPVEGGGALRLGVIKLPSFYGDIGPARRTGLFGGQQERGNSTTDDVTLLLQQLNQKNIDGLVLDLRNNGGGLLDEAIRLAGLFIDEGPVVQVKNSKGQKKVFVDEYPGVLYGGPLIVLTNKLSASASEIVAGALQNYGRAVVIGDSSTHGKGTVQTVTEVGRFIAPMGSGSPDVGAVKLTIQKFYLPNGHSTQKRGVVPDIKLPSPHDYMQIGESTLPHALPWDEIEPSTYKISDVNMGGILEKLKADSGVRITHSESFKNLNRDLEELKERFQEKRVSLNIQKRITEILDGQRRKKDFDSLVKNMEEKSPDILIIEFDEKLKLIERVEKFSDQEAKKPDPQNASATDDEEEISPLADFARDLHLRETLEILKDYILIEQRAGRAVAERTP
ncbi:MAG: carboxy terminal-processing peptidase [Candidatus Methylacidiphilales bacterium]